MRPERYRYQYGARGGKLSGLRPRRGWTVLVMATALLMLLNTHGNGWVTGGTAALRDGLKPVLSTITLPVRGFHALLSDKAALLEAHEENKRLQIENDTLRQWQSVAYSFKAENEALRKLAAYHPVKQVEYITAQVIAQSPDSYSSNLMIDAGLQQGIGLLQPVIDSEGLIGRVVEMGEHTARVMLLSDPLSRVPVVTANSRQRAILAGTGDGLLRMTFLGGESASIALGEPVMTTAEGGLIPENVMVGTVFRREGEMILVKPMRPLAQSEYVRVMVAH